jgi:long-chain fatty acid transport protein
MAESNNVQLGGYGQRPESPSSREQKQMNAARLRRTAVAATVSAAAACALAATNQARASGFELHEGSADWMANAFAGDTAKAYDAATVWSNPAGMARLSQSEIDSSINGIFPVINFSGANYVGQGATTPGTTGGNLIQAAATAGLYGVWSVTPDFKLGIGADAPFGQRVSNPGDFVGRYQSLVSAITDLAFTISGSYKINEQWSIGGGPVVDTFSARLTQAINTGPYAALGDPVADLYGTNVGIGYNLGVLYQATEDLRFGADYRSRIQHNINGTQSIFIPPAVGTFAPPLAAALATQNSSAGAKITLPDSLTAGVYWQATPQLALLSDLAWTDWSLLQALTIVPTSPLAASSTINENWRNTVTVSVGANYRVTNELLLQGGFAFDQSPVSNSNRNSRTPDSNRFDLAIGAQYDILPNVTVQVAYAHVFFAAATVATQASATSGLLAGSYANTANTGSLGIKVRF